MNKKIDGIKIIREIKTSFVNKLIWKFTLYRICAKNNSNKKIKNKKQKIHILIWYEDNRNKYFLIDIYIEIKIIRARRCTPKLFNKIISKNIP